MKQNLSEKEIVAEFSNYLKKNRSYSSYCKNLRENNNPGMEAIRTVFGMVRYIKIRRGSISGIIDKSFTWSNTQQGHGHWSALNDGWCKYYNRLCKGTTTYNSIW